MPFHKALQYKTRMWHCWILHGGIRRSCHFRLFPRVRIDGGLHFYWLFWAGWISLNWRKVRNAFKNSSRIFHGSR
jgi:hypothetical protein